MSDDDLPTFDLKNCKVMGEEETGYRCYSTFNAFAQDKKKSIRGGPLDWAYEQLGCYSIVTELWSLPKKAGIEVTGFIEFFRHGTKNVNLAMLEVVKVELGGYGFSVWTPFYYPKLTPFEIGGRGYQFLAEPTPSVPGGGDHVKCPVRLARDAHCTPPHYPNAHHRAG